MNNTDKTMNKEYKKLTGIGYLIFAVIAYLICAFVLAIIHPDINYLGIVFVELYFLCFWLLCYLFKPNMKPNPVIVAYIILFTVPLFFVLNYRQVYEIGSIDFKKYELLTEKAIVRNEYEGIKGNLYEYKKKCTGIKYDGRLIVFGIFSNPLLCNEVKHQMPFSVKNDNDEYPVVFYGGRNFFKKYDNENSIFVNDYFFVNYIKQKTHIPETSLFVNMLSFDMEKNILHNIYFEEKGKANQTPIILNKKFSENYFVSTYKKQKKRYIIFSILFFINALAFSGVVCRIKRKYLIK